MTIEDKINSHISVKTIGDQFYCSVCGIFYWMCGDEYYMADEFARPFTPEIYSCNEMVLKIIL